MQGNLIWFGNKPDHTEGTVFCFQSDKDGMQQVLPTADNTQEITLDVAKNVIKISTLSRIKCAVCGKFIEIFDTELKCPICEAKAHKEHLTDWVRMKHTCPVCKKHLNVSSTGVIFMD